MLSKASRKRLITFRPFVLQIFSHQASDDGELARSATDVVSHSGAVSVRRHVPVRPCQMSRSIERKPESFLKRRRTIHLALKCHLGHSPLIFEPAENVACRRRKQHAIGVAQESGSKWVSALRGGKAQPIRKGSLPLCINLGELTTAAS